MRYAMLEEGLDARHYICQTYTYSWENHYCVADSLQQRFEAVCKVGAQTFDFSIFLKELSLVMYRPLVLLVYCLRRGLDCFTQKAFNSCMPGQCRREDLTDNGTVLIEKIRKNFDNYLKRDDVRDLDISGEIETLSSLNITEQNAYLHVRGHNLFDLVSYIGSLLCRGQGLSFERDILMKAISEEGYWEMSYIRRDIQAILK